MEELLFSSEDILERVDEYTLYCSYLDYDPIIGARYRSPIRTVLDADEDKDPSFGIYVNTRAPKNIGGGAYPNEFLWRDLANKRGGDIFELVRLLYQLPTRKEAMIQVMIDADIIQGERSRPIIDAKEARFRGYANITISSRDYMDSEELKFWSKGNINRALLSEYNTTSVKTYWLYDDQTYPRFAPRMSFAYRIWDKYQLYFPKAVDKKKKFKTDWIYTCVPGFLQLKYNSDLLIITKSMKDVMVLRSFGYEAISPRGENIMLPAECIQMMKGKYKKILVLFDNDMKHRGEDYEFEKIYVPQILHKDKDSYDYCNNHGPKETAEMLRQITGHG
jgi:hypothetical protein